MTTLDVLERYLMSMIGTFYSYGGATPMGGIDCSGLIVEGLQAIGLLKHGTDLSAQGLHDKFLPLQQGYGPMPLERGALVFFGRGPKEISHVGWCLNGKFMIEAGGGGPAVRSVGDAIRAKAFVKIRPIDYRKDFVGVLMPPYL